jgi:hypothetical protein
VSEGDLVEFGEDEGMQIIGGELFDQNGVGDAALDVVVDAERELGEKLRLRNQDQVVVFGKILEEQAQPAQRVDAHEVGVVDDGHEHFAGVVDALSLLEAAFAAKIPAFGVDLERLAQDAQGGMVGVQGLVPVVGFLSFATASRGRASPIRSPL